ncbi:outer membrane beta-barrel protein [Flavobacterium sp.]|uniref:outer membrane beta-barrel protein n=1 Tax=Flavobacterium sp. TaxID=239 RepID=UPI003BC59B74
MKKNLFSVFLLFISVTVNSQRYNYYSNLELNKLTIEISSANSIGINHYTPGYSKNSDFELNTVNVGARYMFNPIIGLRADVGYMNLKNKNKSYSKDYEVQLPTFGVQGVVNASRLFNINESIGRFGLLLHAGLQISQIYSKTPDEMDKVNPTLVSRSHNTGRKENNIGIIYGISPQFRLTDKLALISDISYLNSFKQHFTWDGALSPESNNLSGKLVSYSIGLTYSLGYEVMHGDWDY